MKKLLYVVYLVVICGGFVGYRVYVSMRSAGEAQTALATQKPFTAQVLAVEFGGRRGSASSVRLLAETDPAGLHSPATIVAEPSGFQDVRELKAGSRIDMLYDPVYRVAKERAFVKLESHWTHWIFR